MKNDTPKIMSFLKSVIEPENKIIALKGSVNVEIDKVKKQIYISEYGEHVCSLSFDEKDQIKKELI